MSFTFSTSFACIKTAGANVNSTITDDITQLQNWSDDSEADICNQARYDCVTNYSNLTSYGKQILGKIHSAQVAQYIINYEPEEIGLTGAGLRLNFLQNVIAQGMNKIDDGKIKSYLKLQS